MRAEAAACILVGRCMHSGKWKQLYVSKVLSEKWEVSLKNIQSGEGIRYRMYRSAQTEETVY